MKENNQIQSCLNNLNFYSTRENLNSLYEYAKLANANAGQNLKPAFEALPSYLSANKQRTSRSCILTIDIGGTSTKAAVKISNGASTEWRLLFENKNLEMLEVALKDNPFTAFCKMLGNQVERSLVTSGIPRDAVTGCGLVWSNAMENKPWIGTGISGLVTQIEEYTKGEWFTQALTNGRDLGIEIVESLRKRNIPIKSFLIANDTPLTMKALANADSGMVASTGLNATILKSEKELGLGTSDNQMICNSEIGGRFYLNDCNIRTVADCIDDQQKALTIEHLSVGNFLPKIFCQYILVLSEEIAELKPLANSLMNMGADRWYEYRSRDLSLVNSDLEFFLNRRSDRRVYTTNVLNLLGTLATELLVRGAELCSVVAYGSIANLVGTKDCLNIALDSRLSREVPIFWNTLKVRVDSLASNIDQKIFLNLMTPLEVKTGKISVPMIGAANGVEEL